MMEGEIVRNRMALALTFTPILSLNFNLKASFRSHHQMGEILLTYHSTALTK
jgi:hypothetical protein